MKLVFCCVVLFSFSSLIFAEGTAKKAAKAADEVVATVNGSSIMKSEFDELYNQNLLFLSNKRVTKEKVLNDIIDQRLGVERAKKIKLEQNPVVKAKMEEVLYHALISKDLEGEFAKITVADKEVEEYYRANKEYRTAHILLRVPVNPSKEQTDAAFTQIFKIYEDVKKDPNSFVSLANKYSQSTANVNGGDIGFQPPTRLDPIYYEAIKGQAPGYIASPIRTQFGYHIVKVLEVKEFKDINVDVYKKIIYDIKRDSILEKYFKTNRSSAKIKINNKYLN